MTSQQGGTNWKCYLKQGLFIAALCSPAGKGLTTWLSFVMLKSVFVTFLCGILGQLWYLIVLILIFALLLHSNKQYALYSIIL